MSGDNVNVPDWKTRLTAELRRDRKKTAVLAILLIVGGIVGGRAVVKCSVPASAEGAAEETQASVAQTDDSAVAPKSSSGMRPGHKMYAPTGVRKITRDLFEPKLDFFPTEQPVAEAPKECNEPVQDEVTEAQAIRAQAKSALTLESTVISTTPTAIINGQVLRKGDWIKGFEVIEVRNRSALVAQKGVQVILDMQN